jgi:small-conductance mechanosensitive channel
MSEFLNYKLFEVGTYVFSVGMVLTVLLILVATRIVIFVLTRIFGRTATKRKMDRGRQYSFLLLMRYFLWILSIFLILHTVGVQITFLIASSAALLVGLGLGLQKLFSDFTSGIFMLFDGTIEKGDILQVGDMVGVVEQINLRMTILRDRDDVIIIVPNHKFTEDTVINWSHNTSVTRFMVKVRVSYSSDMNKVRQTLLDCAAKHPHVVTNDKTYKTTVRIGEFEDSGVRFELLFYSENMFRIESTKSDIRFLIWEAFQKQGISIPYPQMDLHVKEVPSRGESGSPQ